MVHRLSWFLVESSTLDFRERVRKGRPTRQCPGVSGIESRLSVLVLQSGFKLEQASICAARVECSSNVEAVYPNTHA